MPAPAPALQHLARGLAVPMTSAGLAVEVLEVARLRVAAAWLRWRRMLRDVGETAAAGRTLLLAVAEAVDDGLLEEVRSGMHQVAVAVELMEQVNRQMAEALPVLNATAPSLGMVNATLAQLDATVGQLDALPGVRLARRFVARPAPTPAPHGLGHPAVPPAT